MTIGITPWTFLRNAWNFFTDVLSHIVSYEDLEVVDVTGRLQRETDAPLPMHYVWLLFSKRGVLFQVGVCLALAFVLYRWVILPFIQDYYLAERCRFTLETSEPLKAGDTVLYIVSGFLPPSQRNETEENDKHTQTFFNALIVTLTFNDSRVDVMKAYADEDYGRIKVFFPVEKSGTYIIEFRYNGFLIPGCPFVINVPPDSMSPDKTDVIVPCMPVLLTDGMPQSIEIFPNDRTGYPCSGEGVRLDLFDFHASTDQPCCNALLCGKTCEMIGDYWKEGLDASFMYGGSAITENRTGTPVTVVLNLRTNRSPNSYGIFEGQICYNGQIVKCFPIVSLTVEEYERLEPTLKEPKPTDVIQLKGEILQPNCLLDGTNPKGFMDSYIFPNVGHCPTLKEIHINISMKFICIKEVVWTVLLSRTALFTIHGDTKIEAIPETEAKERYIVTISDETGTEVRLRMYASSTRMLMALFIKFRASITGSEFTFSEKTSNFFKLLSTFCNQLISSQRKDFQLLNISRPDLLRTSYEETRRYERVNWYIPFVVSFLREPLLEDSAAWIEWAELILDTVLVNNPLGMFCKISEITGYMHPNHSRNIKRWNVQYYELTGKILGKYLVERALNPRTLNYRVKVRFSRSFLQQLIGFTPTANSLERDMPDVYVSTTKTLTKSNFDDGALTFSVPLYDIYGELDHMIPLIENGEKILVTNDNADLYLNALARYHLVQKVSREISAFRAGFTFIVPEDFLLNFDENELELLLCGWSKLDIGEMKKNFLLVGESSHHEFPRILKWFWLALDNMSPVDHAQFLQFSTGSSILPLGGFAQLNPRLTLSMTCVYGQIPVADPSSHKICFSDHPHFDAFNSALLTAMRTAACCQDKLNSLECIHNSDEMINNNSDVRSK